MKKLLCLGLAAIVSLSVCACGSTKDVPPEKPTVEKPNKPEKPEKPKASVSEFSLNEKLLSYLGKTYAQIKKEYGEPDAFTWYNGGQCAQYKDLGYAYAFQPTNYDSAQPADDDICTGFFYDLGDIIRHDSDKTYFSVTELESMLGTCDSSFNDMEQCNSYSFFYKDCFIVINDYDGTDIRTRNNQTEIGVEKGIEVYRAEMNRP